MGPAEATAVLGGGKPLLGGQAGRVGGVQLGAEKRLQGELLVASQDLKGQPESWGMTSEQGLLGQGKG